MGRSFPASSAWARWSAASSISRKRRWRRAPCPSRWMKSASAVQARSQTQASRQAGMSSAMPSWKQLSDTDLAAVATYTKNSWSNKTGQLVQPAEVLALRGK